MQIGRSGRTNTECPMPPRVTKAEYELLAAFRYAMRRFTNFSANAARERGLTPQQHQALLAIKGSRGRDELTIGEIAEQLQIKQHSAVGLIDRMVAAGWVERHSSTTDRREVYIRLTEDGAQVLDSLTAAHKA